MSTATTVHAHIEYELIEHANHQVLIIDFLSPEIGTSGHARELGEQLHSLIRSRSHQYFVIDFAGARSLGSTAFSEIASFAHKAKSVWACNLNDKLKLGAAFVGLNTCARFAVNRLAAIEEAERTARSDKEKPVDNRARTDSIINRMCTQR
jgi:anti-anti-sigma regulatory factor